MTFAISLFAIALTIAGVFIVQGRTRWIGNTPRCRRCGYLLIGIELNRCPECGKDLTGGAIRYGEPHRRWKSFVLGWVVLPLAALFFISPAFVKLQSVNWYLYKPTFLVFRDLNSPDEARGRYAWAELVRRDSAGSLTASSRERLVRFALDRQYAAPSPNDDLDDRSDLHYENLDCDSIAYLADRCVKGDLPEGQRARFLDQCASFAVKCRPIVVFSDNVPYAVVPLGRGPWSDDVSWQLAITGLTLDEKKLPDPIPGDIFSTAGFRLGPAWHDSMQCPPPGQHHISCSYHMNVYVRTASGAPAATPTYSTDRNVSEDFQVLATRPPTLLKPIDDPNLATKMRASIMYVQLYYDPPGATHGTRLSGFVILRDPPENLAAMVFGRCNGKEFPLGALNCSKGSNEILSTLTGSAPWEGLSRIDLILRPSEEVARNTIDQYSYWNQEIVVPNVPITR